MTQDHTLYSHCCENLKYNIINVFVICNPEDGGGTILQMISLYKTTPRHSPEDLVSFPDHLPAIFAGCVQ
jgi:hypothetical protein